MTLEPIAPDTFRDSETGDVYKIGQWHERPLFKQDFRVRTDVLVVSGVVPNDFMLRQLVYAFVDDGIYGASYHRQTFRRGMAELVVGKNIVARIPAFLFEYSNEALMEAIKRSSEPSAGLTKGSWRELQGWHLNPPQLIRRAEPWSLTITFPEPCGAAGIICGMGIERSAHP